jgi:hypothetical protein
VKRSNKGKNGQQKAYKILDNRDSLPFRVEDQSPDPYTHPQIKHQRAEKARKRPSVADEGLRSSLYMYSNNNNNNQSSSKNKKKQDDRTLIGEYFLDKHTTTGDILEIGDTQYKVVRHKCQYKYAGGQRFVMIRKILQVKEVGRLQTEAYLHRQWRNSEDHNSE